MGDLHDVSTMLLPKLHEWPHTLPPRHTELQRQVACWTPIVRHCKATHACLSQLLVALLHFPDCRAASKDTSPKVCCCVACSQLVCRTAHICYWVTHKTACSCSPSSHPACHVHATECVAHSQGLGMLRVSFPRRDAVRKHDPAQLKITTTQPNIPHTQLAAGSTKVSSQPE